MFICTYTNHQFLRTISLVVDRGELIVRVCVCASVDPPPLLLNGPPPPRALGPPELSSGDVSAGLFGTGIDLTVALVVGALLVLSAMCLVAYMDRRLVEWTKRACCARPSRANPRAANALGGGSKSFHQMHSRRGKIFAQVGVCKHLIGFVEPPLAAAAFHWSRFHRSALVMRRATVDCMCVCVSRLSYKSLVEGLVYFPPI